MERRTRLRCDQVDRRSHRPRPILDGPDDPLSRRAGRGSRALPTALFGIAAFASPACNVQSSGPWRCPATETAASARRGGELCTHSASGWIRLVCTRPGNPAVALLPRPGSTGSGVRAGRRAHDLEQLPSTPVAARAGRYQDPGTVQPRHWRRDTRLSIPTLRPLAFELERTTRRPTVGNRGRAPPAEPRGACLRERAARPAPAAALGPGLGLETTGPIPSARCSRLRRRRRKRLMRIVSDISVTPDFSGL